MKNNIVNIVYSSGSGGEFFTWLLGQQPFCMPVGIDVDPTLNKWEVTTTTTPDHISYDEHDYNGFKCYLDGITFHPTLINLVRSHMHFHDIEDTSIIDYYLKAYYDDWNKAVFIHLDPETEEGFNYFLNLSKIKLQDRHPNNRDWQSLSEIRGSRIKSIGDRNIIFVDPYKFFITDFDKEFDKLIYSLQTTFDKKFNHSKTTAKFFVDIWKKQNTLLTS